MTILNHKKSQTLLLVHVTCKYELMSNNVDVIAAARLDYNSTETFIDGSPILLITTNKCKVKYFTQKQQRQGLED